MGIFQIHGQKISSEKEEQKAEKKFAEMNSPAVKDSA